MKTLVWQHLPCNDDDSRLLAAALNLHPTIARLLCMRGLREPLDRRARRSRGLEEMT